MAIVLDLILNAPIRIRHWLSRQIGFWNLHEKYYSDTRHLRVRATGLYGAPAALCDAWLRKDELEMSDLQVAEGWRGRGIGKATLQLLCARARQLKARKVTGYISRSDFERTPWLAGWYEAFGFRVGPVEQSAPEWAILRIERSV